MTAFFVVRELVAGLDDLAHSSVTSFIRACRSSSGHAETPLWHIDAIRF